MTADIEWFNEEDCGRELIKNNEQLSLQDGKYRRVNER